MADLKKEGYKIIDAPEKTTEQEKQEELNIPAYMAQVPLSDVQKKRLSKEWFLEYDAIDKEWKSKGLIEKFDALDAQYEGELEQYEGQQFNLHKHTTKNKVDAVVTLCKKAFLSSDPRISVSPRPDHYVEDIVQICESQQDYFDYKLDEGEIPFEEPIGKVFHSATGKGVGMLKVPHVIKWEKKKRQEQYKGTPIYAVPVGVPDPANQNVKIEMTEMDHEQFKKLEKERPGHAKYAKMIKNQGLEDFLQTYPEAPKDYKGYVKKLMEGGEIDIIVTYDEKTYDDPQPKYVVLQNFRCRLSVEGYEGMKTTKLLSERMNYTWWELKKEERAGTFFDIDELKFEYDKKGGKKMKGDKGSEKPGYQEETFDVEESVFYWKVNEEDEEETKIRLWIEVESKKVIGCTLYPYYGVDCYWVPFYILKIWAGFLQPGLAQYLTDTNVAENAFLNFTLEAVWAKNMITPIVDKDSEADQQFLDKDWMHGMPINAKKGEIDFLQKYMQNIDVGGLVVMSQMLTRHGDDTSRVSSLMTGKESTMDPTAPARKTLELLKVSGINIEDYIKALLPSFNEVVKIILQLTYQMSKEGRKYGKKGKKYNVKGDEGKPEPFGTISRSAMIARTNIQSQAMAFDFDEMNVKRELLAFYQAFRQEPIMVQNPKAVYVLLRATFKKWSPLIRNNIDELLPDPEEFKKGQLQVAVQALTMYMKAKAQEAQTTGADPDFKLEEIMAIIQQAQQESMTPPPKEEMQAREKEAKSRGQK